MRFSEKLINWYTERKRDLPWRKTKDPYKVWLSEIILQQTRVDQGMPYYEKFVTNYPTISDLANAPEQEVLRLWQGLGYYSRARNLHATAKIVLEKYSGAFPTNYDEIIKLKGIGPYTAAAIASFCFGEPKPVVDGNVFRFASRYFGILDDIAKPSTRKIFEKALALEISEKEPGSFNQGIMEFGATVCSPAPKCDECVFEPSCFAFSKKMQKELPKKTKKIKVKNRYLHYLVAFDGESFLFKERAKQDIWSGLFDFPLWEGTYDKEEFLMELKKYFDDDFIVEQVCEQVKHVLSHQNLFAIFYKIKVSPESLVIAGEKLEASVFSKEEIVHLPKPKLIVNYLQSIGIKS